mmetsp:Transcript_19659/g.19754  ORF Transcript_19659/g.19754 Transcript_19659/m.19754 type:complete len:173 (+) Transcript_19659:105-623(+)
MSSFPNTDYNIKERNKVVENLSEVFTKTLTDSVRIQDEQYQIIDISISDAQKEVDQCDKAMTAVEELTGHIERSVITQLRSDMNELEPLFGTLNAMHHKVIPSLNSDLDVLEEMLTNLEKKHSNTFPTTVRSFLNVMKLTGNEVQPPLDCELNDVATYFRMLNIEELRSTEV